MGTPWLTSLRAEQEAKLSKGCEKGRESKGRIWLGENQDANLCHPTKGGVTIGTNSAGQGRGGGVSWPNSQDGKQNGKGGIKNATLEPTVKKK